MSRWTAEHVKHGRRFHQQVHRLLRPRGTAVHLFSTLYSPVFVVNRLMPQVVRASVVPLVDRSGRDAAVDMRASVLTIRGVAGLHGVSWIDWPAWGFSFGATSASLAILTTRVRHPFMQRMVRCRAG